MVYKMIVLLCSLSAPDCTEQNAIDIDRLSRISPTAERCNHDSQHEQAQMLYRDKARGGSGGKIKVLCIPSPN
jgi:hypothetical protein